MFERTSCAVPSALYPRIEDAPGRESLQQRRRQRRRRRRFSTLGRYIYIYTPQSHGPIYPCARVATPIETPDPQPGAELTVRKIRYTYTYVGRYQFLPHLAGSRDRLSPYSFKPFYQILSTSRIFHPDRIDTPYPTIKKKRSIKSTTDAKE